MSLFEYGNLEVEWNECTDDSDIELLTASQKIEAEYLPEHTANDSDIELLNSSQQIEMEYYGALFSDISDDDKIECGQSKVSTVDNNRIEQQTCFGPYSEIREPDTSSEKQKGGNARFTDISHEQLNDLAFSRLPENTIAKSKWAIRAFVNWSEYRKSKASNSKSVQKDILDMDNKELNDCLSFFMAEIRKQDGSEYMGKTLYELITAIQYHLRINGVIVNFLTDDQFIGLRSVLDGKMKELARKGIGLTKKQADIITEENEEILWRTGILGSDTPKKLLDTIFYLIGLNFALRAGKEHRQLRYGAHSQITLHTSDSGVRYLKYTEDVSKSNQGGIKHLKHSQKCVKAFENRSNPEKCIVQLYEKYVNLRPSNCSSDAFYLQPSKMFSTKVWYNRSPLGVHTLQGLVKNMCSRAGIKGYFTNHSLRATAATRLYNAGLDEQLIAETTGHSSDAVRAYKRTSEEQLKTVSDIIQNKKPKLQKEQPTEHCNDEKLKDVENSEPRHLCIENKHFKLSLKF